VLARAGHAAAGRRGGGAPRGEGRRCRWPPSHKVESRSGGATMEWVGVRVLRIKIYVYMWAGGGVSFGGLKLWDLSVQVS
jgi:hypothetical protein